MVQLYFFVCALIVFIAWNWWLIEHRGGVDHAVQQIIRSCVWALLALLLEDNWPDRLMYLASYHFAFGLPFDWSLNLLFGKNILYIGETAWSDKLGRQWPAAFWGLKLILFLIGMGTLVFGTAW